MFNSLTDYEGVIDGLHKFKIKQFNENIDAIKFYFYFDQDLKFVKSSLSQNTFDMIGDLSVDVVEPMNVRKFSAKDWYMSECE
jgi:hypothetical protein